jgi:RNA-directed DNA polymerase
LANMTLDGLEEIARRAAPSNQKVHVVRYADDCAPRRREGVLMN